VKLTILGSGAALPSARHNNCSFVAHSAQPILFECGPSILYQLAVAGISPESIRTVIVSHIHGDHSLGLPMLLVSGQIAQRERPLTICLPSSAVDQAKRVCTTVYPGLERFMTSKVQWIGLPEKDSASLMLPGKTRVTTAPAHHPVPVVSSHVSFEPEGRDLTFSGDTAFCEAVARNAEGTGLLLHDSNWSDKLKNGSGHGHSSAADAGRVASLARAKRLALVHRAAELEGHEPDVRSEAAGQFSGDVLVPGDFSTIDL